MYSVLIKFPLPLAFCMLLLFNIPIASSKLKMASYSLTLTWLLRPQDVPIEGYLSCQTEKRQATNLAVISSALEVRARWAV